MQEIKESECDRNLAPVQSNIPTAKLCHHCEGKGYIELRNCSGEIQREENCSFCNGTGKADSEELPD
jgi:DnaJ-class molecular chaperone